MATPKKTNTSFQVEKFLENAQPDILSKIVQAIGNEIMHQQLPKTPKKRPRPPSPIKEKKRGQFLLPPHNERIPPSPLPLPPKFGVENRQDEMIRKWHMEDQTSVRLAEAVDHGTDYAQTKSLSRNQLVKLRTALHATEKKPFFLCVHGDQRNFVLELLGPYLTIEQIQELRIYSIRQVVLDLRIEQLIAIQTYCASSLLVPIRKKRMNGGNKEEKQTSIGIKSPARFNNIPEQPLPSEITHDNEDEDEIDATQPMD